MDSFFDSSDLIKNLFAWRKRLFVVFIISILVSIAISFVIPEKFKADATVYPSNLNSYSGEAPTEQLLQFLQSEEIYDKLISTFDLASHYKVEPGAEYSRTTVIEIFKENLSVNKTEYESIEMNFIDSDPEYAARILDSLIVYVHHKIKEIHNVQLDKSISSVKKEMKLKEMELDTLNKKLDYYRDEFGIINYSIQTEEAYTVYYEVKGNSNAGSSGVKEIGNLLEDIKLHGWDQSRYSLLAIAAMEDYVNLKRHYEKKLEEKNYQKVYVNVVSAPQVPEKKHSPVRWLIVLSLTFTSLFFAVVMSYFIENAK